MGIREQRHNVPSSEKLKRTDRFKVHEDLFFSRVNIVKQISGSLPLPLWHFQWFSQQFVLPSPSIYDYVSLFLIPIHFFLHCKILCRSADESGTAGVVFQHRRPTVSSPRACPLAPEAGSTIFNGRQLKSPQREKKGEDVLFHFFRMCSGKLQQLATTRIKIQSTWASISSIDFSADGKGENKRLMI